MNLFLKAKHWQLFLLTVLLPMLAYFIFMGSIMANVIPMIENPNAAPDPMVFQQMFMNQMSWMPVIMILFMFFVFGWQWQVAVGLQEKIPSHLRINVIRFKIFFFIPIVYMVVLSFGSVWFMKEMFQMAPDIENINENMIFTLMPILMIMHFFSFFCIFHTMYFTAKTIKLAEVKKQVSFGDFIGEFFLIWFYFIGVWILQPRVNKIFKNELEDELSLEDNLVI